MTATPLDEILVVDLTHALAGPMCTHHLRLMGARLIKVEPPRHGDDFRAFLPDVFNAVNAGKESLTLNLKRPAALNVLRRLIERADVLVDNFKPGTAEKMGITWERVQSWNPRTIWCSISGFGLDGPWRDLPAVEWSVQAGSGLADQYLDDEADPRTPGLAVLDVGTGLCAVNAILAALLQRGQSGTGQRVDVAMLDVALTFLSPMLSRPGAAPRLGPRPAVGRFQAKDRRVFIMGAHQRWFEAIAQVMGAPLLHEDPRFATPERRQENAEALLTVFEERLAARTAAEWEQLFTAAGVPAATVRPATEVIESEHTRARGNIASAALDDGKEPAVIVGLPFRSSAHQRREPGGVSPLGANARSILEEFGYSAKEISALSAEGLI